MKIIVLGYVLLLKLLGWYFETLDMSLLHAVGVTAIAYVVYKGTKSWLWD